MKVITICGSLKYQEDMMITADKLGLEGDCILTPVYPVLKDYNMTKEQLKNIKDGHLKRIELSDAIYVINKNNYIGESTKLEIEYAKKLGKEIMYLESTKY